MKVWYTLGVNGVRVLSIRESFKTLAEKVVESEAGSGVATFTFAVRNRYEARKVITKIDRWLSNQDWYKDDEIVSFSTCGLMSENGEEWVCDECNSGIDGCRCNTMESSPNRTPASPTSTVINTNPVTATVTIRPSRDWWVDYVEPTYF